MLGTSKMNSSIFGEAVFGVIKLKYDSWFKKYPQKKVRLCYEKIFDRNATVINDGCS